MSRKPTKEVAAARETRLRWQDVLLAKAALQRARRLFNLALARQCVESARAEK